MRIFISTILVTFFLLVPELFAATSNRVVAFVNDDVITLYELNNMIEERTGKTSEELKSENEQDFFNIRKQILDLMIDDRLTKEKIKELETSMGEPLVTEEEVDGNIENMKKNYKMTQEDFIAGLEKQGQTYDKFRKQLKEYMQRDYFIGREIRGKMVITEEQISDYYESNKKNYERPGKAHIASIFLVPDSKGILNQSDDDLKKKGEEILARLQNGEAFADLAREFSNGPGAKEGGDLGDIPLTDVDPKIMEVINSLEEGETSALIKIGKRFQIIKLIKRTETEWIPFEEVKDEIGRLIYDKEIENRLNEYMEKLKKESYIKVVL